MKQRVVRPAASRWAFTVGAISIGTALALAPRAAHAMCDAPDAAEGFELHGFPTPTVDWNAVKGSGKTFVLIRASGNVVDPAFGELWAGAKSVGMLRGAWHFFYPEIDATQQAQDFVNTIGADPGEIPPALDVECFPDAATPPNNGCDTTGISGAEIAARVQVWLDYVQQHIGKVPMIYTYPSYFSGLGTGVSQFAKYPLWIATVNQCNGGDSAACADPSVCPTCAASASPWGSTYAFHQYSWCGSIPGVNVAVDLDRFEGNLAALLQFDGGGSGGGAPPPVTPAIYAKTSEGDFNGDGLTDFTSADPNFDTWLSVGDGTLRYGACGGAASTCTAPPSWCGGNAATCLSGTAGHVIAGDVDGDGIGDFVSANGNFDVWRGAGDGTFVGPTSTPPQSFCAMSSANGCLSNAPNAVLPGDFNGDGRIDFLSANPNFDAWLAVGDGTYRYAACGGAGATCTPPPSWCPNGASGCLSGASNHIVIGDFNGDGRTDFMSANGNFDVWTAVGDGTFTYGAAMPPGFCNGASGCLSTQPNHVIVGDFNGDGLTDFMSANGNFDVFLAAGDGTFTYTPCGSPGATCTPPPSWCPGGATGCVSTAPNHVIAGDFNGDGRTDFMSANGNFDVWLSVGDGTFTYVAATPPAFCNGAGGCLSGDANHVVVGDFNGDGMTDFMSANGNFDVFLAVGDGTFKYAPCGAMGPTCTAPPSFCSMGAGSCLNKGTNDVIVGN